MLQPTVDDSFGDSLTAWTAHVSWNTFPDDLTMGVAGNLIAAMKTASFRLRVTGHPDELTLYRESRKATP